MGAFDVEAYGPVIAGLLRGVLSAPLDAGTPNEKYRAALAGLTAENLLTPVGRILRDERMAQACLAGLWLRHNFMEESHGISQELETPTGSFWHGILHRREPDHGNARYWFRRVGAHPVFPALNEAARAEGWPVGAQWNAGGFVDAVQQASRKGTEEEKKLCVTVQQREWELLFDYCWTQAGGG